MGKILEGVTIETLPEAVREGPIRLGQRFAILLDDKRGPRRPTLSEIADRMRATAQANGMTTEIFDAILARD